MFWLRSALALLGPPSPGQVKSVPFQYSARRAGGPACGHYGHTNFRKPGYGRLLLGCTPPRFPYLVHFVERSPRLGLLTSKSSSLSPIQSPKYTKSSTSSNGWPFDALRSAWPDPGPVQLMYLIFPLLMCRPTEAADSSSRSRNLWAFSMVSARSVRSSP